MGISKDIRHKERQEIYNTKRWKDLRRLIVQEHPLCEDCLKNGRITPTEEVHHILSPFKKGLSEEEKIKRAYDVDNLVALCKDCHIKRHHKDELTMKEKLLKYSD